MYAATAALLHTLFFPLGSALQFDFGYSCEYNSCRRQSCEPSSSSKPRPWNEGESEDAFFKDYRTYEEIQKFVQSLERKYSDRVTMKTIGHTSEGRNITLLEISNKKAGTKVMSDRPVLYLHGGIHSREWIAISTALYITWKLVTEAPAEDLKKYMFVSVPLLNADGYHYNWHTNRMWRKNRRNVKACQGSGGTDPNRNWGYKWRVTEDDGYRKEMKNPCTTVYAGDQAFSEPETNAVARYLSARQNISLQKSSYENGKLKVGAGYVGSFIGYHSYGNVLLPPWGYKIGGPPDQEWQKELNRRQADAISKAGGKSFSYGPDVFSSDPGTAPDWTYGALGVKSSMTIELDGGWHRSFCIGKSNIEPIGSQQWEAYKALIEYCNENEDCKPSEEFGPFHDLKTDRHVSIAPIPPPLA